MARVMTDIGVLDSVHHPGQVIIQGVPIIGRGTEGDDQDQKRQQGNRDYIEQGWLAVEVHRG